AARAAGGEVLVFCNDDVELGTGSLARLAEVLHRRPDAGVVGPVGSRWDLARGKHLTWLRPDSTAADGVAECDVVSGFLFACRRGIGGGVGAYAGFYAPGGGGGVAFGPAVRAAGRGC